MGVTALPEENFSNAKADLSRVMDDVVHNHQPRVVNRRRESMLLVRPDDLARWLDTFRFRVTFVFDSGEVTAQIEDLGVLGFGESSDEALEDLACELRLYARRFFENASFYERTDRARHFPYLLRFAATPADTQVQLLVDDMEALAVANRQQGALVSHS